MSQVDLKSETGVGIAGNEVFVTVTPPLLDEEVEVLEWAGALSTGEVEKVDESYSLVSVELPTDSLEPATNLAHRKAFGIMQTFNHLKLRQQVTQVSSERVYIDRRTRIQQ